jgi:hypothetical protein
MTSSEERSEDNSTVSYIADLVAELAAMAAAEGHKSLTHLLHIARFEAEVLCGRQTPGMPVLVPDNPSDRRKRLSGEIRKVGH